jgi:imidazolonepropionase
MTVIKNVAQILTLTGKNLGIIEHGLLSIEGNKISGVRHQTSNARYQKSIDARGCIVMPGFVDCHTHLVFAGSRENELALRLEGKTYKEILAAGGGILQTVSATRKVSEQELFNTAQKRIKELIRWGTTSVEIKSGYGLDIPTELKILRVIKRLRRFNKDRITIIPTFLGAHAIPANIKKTNYIQKLISEMLPLVVIEKLAQFCDVFCENFVFNAQESKKILLAGKKFGLIPKIHADEIESSGGAEIAGEVKAISAEHLLYPSENGLKAMKKNDVTAVLLPGTTLFLKSKQIPPIEKMRKLGLTIALGSDFNPGTCMI